MAKQTFDEYAASWVQELNGNSTSSSTASQPSQTSQTSQNTTASSQQSSTGAKQSFSDYAASWVQELNGTTPTTQTGSGTNTTQSGTKNGTTGGTKNTAKNGTNSSTQNYADVLYNYSKFKDATSNNKGRGGRTSSARQEWLYQQAQNKAATDDAQTQQNTVNQINQEYAEYNNQTRSDYAEALYNYYKWQGQTGKDTQYGNRTDAYYRNLANSKASTATVEEMQQMYDEMTAAYNSDQTAAQSDYDLEQDYRDAKKAYDKAVSAQSRWNDTKQYGSTAYVGDADTITANHAKAVAEAKAALAAAEAKLNGRGIEIPDTSFWGTIKNAFTPRDTTTTEGFTKDEAEEYTQLQNRLTQIEDAQNYVTTTEQSDALEQERKEVINKLAEMDKSAGRAGRTYGSTDAAESFFSTIGNNAAKTATNLWGWFNESNAQTTSDYIQESLNKWEEDYNNAVAKYGANSEEAKAEKAKLDANANYQSLKSSLATVKEKEAADSRLSGSGGLLGTKEERQDRATSAYELADKYKAQADEARQSLTYGQSDVGKFLTEAGLTGAEMLQDTAVGALTGIPGAGLVNMGLRVFSNTAQESRLEGDSLSTQGQKGIVAALTEVLPEVLFGPFELAYGKSLVSSSVKKFAESKAVRVALDALGEGSEEVISSFLNIVADHALGWSEDGKTIAQDLQDQSGDMLYEFLLGAFMGAIGATGQVVIEGANNATVKTPTVENTEVATTREMTAADARAALSNVEGLNLEAGRVNNTAANTIIADPTLEQAFTTLTGVQLDGTTAQMRQQISDGVRSYGYQQTQAKAADTAFQSEAEAALTQQSQQQAAREVQLDEGVKAQQELNEERANFTYDSYVRGLINAGDITYVEAKALVKNENLRAIWERMTGIKLPTNVNKAAQTVVQYRGKYNAPQSKITDEAETTTVPEQTAGQTSTPIAEAREHQGEVATPKTESVKQDVSDALNTETNVESAAENVASNVVESTPKAKKPRAPKKTKADKAAQTVEQNSNTQPQAQTAPTDTTDTAAVPPTENTNTGNAGQGAEKERGFSANVRTDAAMESEVRQSFEEAPEMYKQLANKDTLQKAQDIYNQGFDSARSQVEQAIGAAKNGAKLAPEMIPLARMVANELSHNGDVDSARRILSDVAVELTAAGQLGQAGRILRNADPVSALQSIEKSLDSINAEFAKLHKHSDWEAELTEEERNTILNTDFTKEGAYQDVYEKITKRIGKEMPSTLFEKITELRRINMLLRPRTMIKNVASNVPMIGLRKGAETLSTGIQAALTKMGAMEQTERTRGIASKDQVKMAREYYDTHKDDINGNGNKWDIRSMLRENRTIFKGGLLEKTISKMSGKEVESFTEGLRQLTYNLLEAGDAPFVKSAFVDSLSQYCAARKITDAKDITSEAVEFATVNAMEATFKNANVIANAVNTLKRNASPAVSYAIDVIIPFTTTPANILTLMGDYSPVGLAKMFAKDGAAAKIDAFSKATVGTAIMALGFAARNLNWITGGEDDDDDKAALDAATGRGEYSINGTVSYDWAQPAGSLLAFGAEIADAVKGQEDWTDAIMNAIYVAGDSTLEMSLFQNIISILKGSGSPTQEIIDTILEGNATQLVPGLVGDIAKLIDENKRSTYTGGNVIDDMKAKVMAVLPGESEKLPESVNVKGETNTRGSTWQRILNTLLNPADVTHGERNEVDNEIYRLYDTTGSTTFFPSVSPYKVEYGGETYQMSGEERETFQKTQGTTYYKLAQPLITSEMYSKLSDDEKANLLNDIRDYALDEAKREFVENKGGEYSSSKWNDVSDMSDTDAASYLTAKSALSDLKNGKGTGSTYDAVDYLIDNFSKLSTRVQNTLTDDGINVTQLRYANVVGIDSKEYYRLRNAVSADTAEWGAKTNLAKTISIYNNMPDASNEELINALDAMLQTTSGDHPTIVKRIESYIKTVGDNANVGEFLNLMVAMNDLGYGDTLSAKEKRALWPALGAKNNNDTIAGLTRDQFYQLMKSTQYNTVITNEANARQENVEYNEINPEEEKETVILGGRLSGVDALIANFS